MVGVPGALGAAHKGCFESHHRLIASSLDDADPLFVLEDDAAFSRLTFATVDDLLGRNHDWDLLFTDVGIADGGFVLQLAANRDAMLRDGRFAAINLKGRQFSGSAAYVVRGSSKAKLDGLLRMAPLDVPYDLHLRALCDAGHLKVAACFPFVTTISDAAEVSQISRETMQVQYDALNAFRRLMFVERDIEACRRAEEAIRARSDEVALMVGTSLSALIHAPR